MFYWGLDSFFNAFLCILAFCIHGVAFSDVPISVFRSGYMKPLSFLGFGDNLSQIGFASNCNTFCPYSFANQTFISNGFENSLLMNLGQGFAVGQIQEFNKPLDIQQTKALALPNKLMITAPCPLIGMVYHAGAHHVEVDVAQAIPQVTATINHGAMESLSPESAAAMLAEVIIICKFAFQLLHKSAEIRKPIAHSKQMNMVAGYAKVKERYSMLVDSMSQAGAVFNSVESAS